MADIIGVGVIGTGWMGTAHSRADLQAADRFSDSGIRARLVICADEIEARAPEAQQRFGFKRPPPQWQYVIRDPEVQVVNITPPNHRHLELATAAAAAG